MSLHDRIAHTRKKLRRTQRERHDAKPGGDRRKKLARIVQWLKDKLERLKKALAAKPDWGGHVPVLGAAGAKIVAKANSLGLVVTATTDGQHATTSYHYLHRAIDFGVDWGHLPPGGARAAEVTLQNWIDRNYPNAREIFGPDSHYVKNGIRYAGMFPDHGDHVHVAI